MIDFNDFRPDRHSPVYLQILAFIKRGALAGTIKNGDELPSRRSLSARLGINPNTVQKAFAILEEEGLVCSHSGAKSVMVLSPERIAALKKEMVSEEVQQFVSRLRQMGLSKEEALQLVAGDWEEALSKDAAKTPGSASAEEEVEK